MSYFRAGQSAARETILCGLRALTEIQISRESSRRPFFSAPRSMSVKKRTSADVLTFFLLFTNFQW